MTAEPSDSHCVTETLALPAALFTATGKRAALVNALDERSASLMAGEGGCPDGSIAILVRHGVRVFGTLHRMGEAVTRFDFDDPLDGWRQARFRDDRRPLRPVIVSDGRA